MPTKTPAKPTVVEFLESLTMAETDTVYDALGVDMMGETDDVRPMLLVRAYILVALLRTGLSVADATAQIGAMTLKQVSQWQDDYFAADDPADDVEPTTEQGKDGSAPE